MQESVKDRVKMPRNSYGKAALIQMVMNQDIIFVEPVLRVVL